MNIEVSFVVTVYNKEKYIANTIASLERNAHNINCEYIFVDDVSGDKSVEIIKEHFKDKDNYQIIQNQVNQGPSISLNRGCKIAKGKYLFLIDSDDILAVNSLKIMLNGIKKEKADFIFGEYKITKEEQGDLLSKEMSQDTSYKVSTSPLYDVLNGRYVRMSYLLTKDLFLRSAGANEKIFIQDESLPLSLAFNSSKMLTMDSPAVYAGKIENSLSKNKNQQIHDRFYAYYYSLCEFTNITSAEKSLLYKRAISSVWKAKRISKSICSNLFFFKYLQTKLFVCYPDARNLEQYRNFMDNLANVRKIS